MNQKHYRAMCEMLSERFGDPIVNNVPQKANTITEGVCTQCGAMPMNMDQSHTCQIDNVDEKAPPGGERMVQALKRDKNIDNPWAIAWAKYNKQYKNRQLVTAVCRDGSLRK